MIIVKTNIPKEMIKYLSDYFYINNCFTFITIIDEINDETLISSIILEYGGKIFNDKITLTYPLIIFTENDDVIEYLEYEFVCDIIMNEAPSFDIMIKNGFLPISSDVISYIIESHNLEKYDSMIQILKIFEVLGYVRNVKNIRNVNERNVNENIFLPTEKLIESINDCEPDISNAFKILINNEDVYLNQEINIDKVNSSLFELLKLIDIFIFENKYMQNNEMNDETNEQINNEINVE